MCGRYVKIMNAEEIRKIFGIEDVPEFEPKFNQAPGSMSPIVHLTDEGPRMCTMMRWGLIPFWSKDGKVKNTSNARLETIRTAGSYREPFKRRRCLVPVNGYYEWQEVAGVKYPYFITLQNNAVMAFAGIYDRWKNPETGETVESISIITCEPNEMMKRVHDRMPVILDEAAWNKWLSPETTADDAHAMLVPYPSELMRLQRVSRMVGNSRNEGAHLIQPVAEDDRSV